MSAKSASVLPQAALELLILRTVLREPLHGYRIALRLHQTSDELLRVEEGSLYPALHRLEQEGLLRSEWQASETNRRARYYTLTARGRRRLIEQQANWERLTDGVSRVLRFA